MTRRSTTTINVQLSLRIPPGSNAAAVLDFIERALCEHKQRMNPQTPLAALDLNGMRPRLVKRETTYL